MNEPIVMEKRGAHYDPVMVLTAVIGEVARAYSEGFFLSNVDIAYSYQQEEFVFELEFILDENPEDRGRTANQHQLQD